MLACKKYFAVLISDRSLSLYFIHVNCTAWASHLSVSWAELKTPHTTSLNLSRDHFSNIGYVLYELLFMETGASHSHSLTDV